ncbi:ATP-dependent helicase [Anaerobium acetethylicum]|uniref:DNA helicase-2 / ATP-dependent DNA helicase PcrA n=1 Tax=Anaerobium acetethylicum TaxID=1619234 RepID=A0A1D3TYM0_9FIRM|nr:ATP-dependent helicase [Anaerobium acetethylicum]SCP99564.1 DNA helicase-2 / ATP-dependent DNA helicase PcrA [Anaerobium acetethylicum]
MERARIEYILDFENCHEGTKTILLNKNYRSTPNILDASNSLIKNNKKRIDKELIAMKETNVPTIYKHARTTKMEAEWISNQIKSLLENGKKYSNIAILYRAHFVSRSIEEIFFREKIPYTLYSGIEFYKRKEVKDIVSYLRMVVYADDLSFQRVINEPKRNFGKKRMLFLKEYAELHNCSLYNALKDNMEDNLISSTDAASFVGVVEKYSKLFKELSLSDILSNILDESGYESMLRQAGEQERLDNLSELKQSVFEFEKTSGEKNSLEEYLQNVALFSNVDKDYEKNSVKMMTIHTAKGLEFPYVFICGLNEGIFPSKHVDTEDKLEEERRMAYVAYTRAENALFLSDAEGLNYDNSFRYPSRFIFNTDKAYLSYSVELEERLIDDAKEFIKTNEEKILMPITCFHIGDTVKHKIFGTGRIIDIKNEIAAYAIKFDNAQTERNLSIKTPLERVSMLKEMEKTDFSDKTESKELCEVFDGEKQKSTISETENLEAICLKEEMKTPELKNEIEDEIMKCKEEWHIPKNLAFTATNEGCEQKEIKGSFFRSIFEKSK